MPVIHNLISKSLHKESTNIQIINLIKITNKFIKNNPNIIFTRANKGNITVASEKTEYLNEIKEMLKGVVGEKRPFYRNFFFMIDFIQMI